MTQVPTRVEISTEPLTDGSTSRPVAIDLFSGAGGLSLGLEQAGFDVVTAVEYDPIHCATHAFNFPRTEVICGDIATVSKRELTFAARSGLQLHGRGLSTWDGDVDLVAGGPPCQGFSTIGRRLVDDTRNALVFQFFRVVRELRPKYFLMENVPGMVAGGHKTAILDRLVEEFGDAGYSITEPISILSAPRYGVPQDRRRLFIIGAREGLPIPSYPEPQFEPREKRTGAHTRDIGLAPLPLGPSVWDAIGDLPDADAFADLVDTDATPLPPSAVAEMTIRVSRYARRLRGDEVDDNDLSHPRTWDPSMLTSSMRTAHTAVSTGRFASTDPGTVEPVSRFYRITKEGLCSTIRAGTGSEHGAFTSPRPIHPALPRVLTVREAARLHGFPDWFRFHSTKWHGFRQVGNAVPPPLGRAVARQVVEILGVETRRPAVRWDLGDPAFLYMDMTRAANHFDAERNLMPAQRRRVARTKVVA